MYYFINVGCRHINPLNYLMNYFPEAELEEMAEYTYKYLYIIINNKINYSFVTLPPRK